MSIFTMLNIDEVRVIMEQINITVHLFAGLGQRFPQYDIQKGLSLTVQPKTSISNLLKSINVSYKNISLAIVNGQRKSLSTRLQEGDRVDLFPPVGGG